MTQPLALAMIGCGKLARIHLECVQRIEGARFVAYADIRRDAAQKCLADFGGDYATDDVDRILRDDAVDAVYICTMHDSHAPLAIRAAEAGKHVLIEKPLALVQADCERVAEAVARAGIHLMPAFKMRYYPLVRQAVEFIERPLVLVGQMMDARWDDKLWAQDPVRGGANVHSQGCHTTDVLRFMSRSEPVEVWAAGGTMTHPGHPCIDQCVATIRFANGCVASWVQGDAAMGMFTSKFFFELFAHGRSVQLHDRLKKGVFSEGNRTWEEVRPDEEGFYLENVEFISALREGRAPAQTAHDGLQATRMVLAADRAIRTGQVQRL
jgi:predicted dehydrogenase